MSIHLGYSLNKAYACLCLGFESTEAVSPVRF